MSADEAVRRYYDAWQNKGGDFSEVPLAEDFEFTGPVASFDSADGYRAMAREAGRAVTSFVVRRQFVDGDSVCSIIDWEMAIPASASSARPRCSRWPTGRSCAASSSTTASHCGARWRHEAGDRCEGWPVSARSSTDTSFEELAERYRRELLVHCYRITGSVQDAEDLVQETLLSAWRGLEGFEGRASMRTWLYRIATNRCLNALRDRGRRLPEPPPPPEEPAVPPAPTRLLEPIWLEPFPGEPLDRSLEPDARYESREAIGLAFIAGLQRLPPRQRAVFVLRDVLGFRASEAAEMLGVTEASANGALRRARSALGEGAERDRAPLPDSAAERDVVARFVEAFEGGDVEAVVALLTDDASLTMPPTPLEYLGPAAIAGFLSTVPAGGRLDRFRLVPTRANGQPAFGCYQLDAQAIGHAYGLMVLTLQDDRVVAITGFPDTGLFRHFGLPRRLPVDLGGGRS